MSALVSEAGDAIRRGAEIGGLPLAPGVIATALIVVFLVQREVLRARPGTRPAGAHAALGVVIGPLALVFAITAGARFAELLP